MVDENGNRIPGEVPDEEILKHPERHSKAVMKEFYRTRNSARPATRPTCRTLNDYKFIRAFTAYDEWQNSKFSQRNPLTFITPTSPPARIATCARANCCSKTRRKARHVGLASLAGGQHGRSVLLRL
jgi:hypothetical protein